MAGEWEETTVGELVKRGVLERPLDGNHGSIHPKGDDFVTAGVPFIMASDLVGGGIDTLNCSFISIEQAKSLRKGFAKRGDVLISHKATLGRTALVGEIPGDFVMLTPQVTYYRPKDATKLNNRYLKYYFDSEQFQQVLQSWAGAGSTRAYIGITDQLRLPVLLPPLAAQKAIAAVLGALDDKIELNRRMNATLESMARALFQSWFVDFDPVRAKLDGRQPDGLDPGTAALFPEHLEDSPLGHIPKGWAAHRLPDVIEINPRRALKSGSIAPYLDMKNLPTQGHSAEEVIDREFSSGTKFQNGDTLLARITPCLENGKTGYVDFLDDGQVGWGSTECIVFAPKPPLPPQFGYLLARSDALRTHAIQNMTGTSGRQRVPSECFNTFWLAAPPPDIADLFHEHTAPLMEEIKANADQSRILATLRDTLLPKLLSGELSVASVEKEVSA
jgi:type I restriction enzyme S subunit